MRGLVLALLIACGAKPSPPAPAVPVKPAEVVGLAPQMFSIEQLRNGNSQGRLIELRVELDGKPTTIQQLEFTAVDDTGATIHAVTRDEAGQVLSDETGTSTWVELHKHGQFPAASTTIQDDISITVPAGTFTTRLYTVTAGASMRRFWFSTELPGPPVQFTTETDGKSVMRAQMLRAK